MAFGILQIPTSRHICIVSTENRFSRFFPLLQKIFFNTPKKKKRKKKALGVLFCRIMKILAPLNSFPLKKVVTANVKKKIHTENQLTFPHLFP